jgi:hypothetical protein
MSALKEMVPLPRSSDIARVVCCNVMLGRPLPVRMCDALEPSRC